MQFSNPLPTLRMRNCALVVDFPQDGFCLYVADTPEMMHLSSLL
jgi:hypothetical protein